MSTQFERYRFRDGRTLLNERTFNPIFRDIDLRIAALEQVQASWEAAVELLTTQGLLRINETIQPTLDTLNADVAAAQALLDALPSVATQADIAKPTAESITYDANGNVIQVVATVNGVARTTDITYDANGNVDTVTINDGTVLRTETYTYDANGVLTGMTAVEV
jgi:YD repeat-containing protein